MSKFVLASWTTLALIHTPPAVTAIAPSLIDTLYGVAPAGVVGVLLIHRGAMFLAIAALCAYAGFNKSARRPASLVAAISMISFLMYFVAAGASPPLRAIAIADGVGLLPLTIVAIDAWRPVRGGASSASLSARS